MYGSWPGPPGRIPLLRHARAYMPVPMCPYFAMHVSRCPTSPCMCTAPCYCHATATVLPCYCCKLQSMPVHTGSARGQATPAKNRTTNTNTTPHTPTPTPPHTPHPPTPPHPSPAATPHNAPQQQQQQQRTWPPGCVSSAGASPSTASAQGCGLPQVCCPPGPGQPITTRPACALRARKWPGEAACCCCCVYRWPGGPPPAPPTPTPGQGVTRLVSDEGPGLRVDEGPGVPHPDTVWATGGPPEAAAEGVGPVSLAALCGPPLPCCCTRACRSDLMPLSSSCSLVQAGGGREVS